MMIVRGACWFVVADVLELAVAELPCVVIDDVDGAEIDAAVFDLCDAAAESAAAVDALPFSAAVAGRHVVIAVRQSFAAVAVGRIHCNAVPVVEAVA